MIPDTLIERCTLPKVIPPIRAYIHLCGIYEAYWGSNNGYSDRPLPHLNLVFENNLKSFEVYDLLFAVLWGNNKDKMIDFIGLKLPKDTWPGNPNMESMVFKNGLYQPEEKEIICGDGWIAIGEEEKLRRKTKDLQEFLYESPRERIDKESTIKDYILENW